MRQVNGVRIGIFLYEDLARSFPAKDGATPVGATTMISILSSERVDEHFFADTEHGPLAFPRN
jgi:hypothetical protein